MDLELILGGSSWWIFSGSDGWILVDLGWILGGSCVVDLGWILGGGSWVDLGGSRWILVDLGDLGGSWWILEASSYLHMILLANGSLPWAASHSNS